MLSIRRADERGTGDHGWLLSKHTFSFAGYVDPDHMGFRALRVINEDRVAPARGFGAHAHRDMEIISYVLDGALEHADSTGVGSVIRPGDVQRMSAGSGVTHREYNHSSVEPVHFLQIWIEPSALGLPPSYEQRHFSSDDRRGKWCLVASRDGREGSVRVHQDVDVYAALIAGEEQLDLAVPEGRHFWLHVARGELTLADQVLGAGDAASGVSQPLRLSGGNDAEVLLFDLA